jgi:hypothetical protein
LNPDFEGSEEKDETPIGLSAVKCRPLSHIHVSSSKWNMAAFDWKAPTTSFASWILPTLIVTKRQGTDYKKIIFKAKRRENSVIYVFTYFIYVTYVMQVEGKVKVKVKLALSLTKHHTMKTYWGSGGIAPRILDFGTRWR